MNKIEIIHGPCSLESYEQMDEIIQNLKGISSTFRCGIYKPRTNPDSFQGLKKDGIEILKKLKQENPQIKLTVEITSIDQLNEIDEIDIIQIGARNMQNYELLIAVGKTQKRVLLKRGFGATVEELISSAKYIQSQGNDNIILCERGIRTFSNSSRFTLDLSAVGFLQKKTTFPVFVDPSHAGGTAEEVIRLTKAAVAYGVDGILIEVHPDPKHALSDSEQQLNIEEYQKLINEL